MTIMASNLGHRATKPIYIVACLHDDYGIKSWP